MPFDVDDLPGYAGAMFDHLVARPDIVRLRLWKLLERPTATALEPGASQRRAADVAEAQQRGDLASGMRPDDLLTMVLAGAQAWFLAAEDYDPSEVGTSWTPERRALHRHAVVMCGPWSSCAARSPQRALAQAVVAQPRVWGQASSPGTRCPGEPILCSARLCDARRTRGTTTLSSE
ncbi:hypothetical protein AB0L59_18955 [Streptomyces sp. NPDC052109]|uniref:hypothetical protein n=1 Tax=Streptomyces sp. NPDC052109 TaxID=3155527 RepID=UPI00343DCBB2